MTLRVSAGLSEERELAVRAELQRLSESPAFRNSKRCRGFLEYIVERTISGPAGALRERAIGVELFGLEEDFDSGQHTVVRVTANEVRKKLALYYQSDTAQVRDVRIELPRGSYTAEFLCSAPDPAPDPAPEPEPVAEPVFLPPDEPAVAPAAPVPSPARRRLAVTGAAMALLVGVCGLVWWFGPAPRRAASQADEGAGAGLAAGGAVTSGVRIIAGSSVQYVDHSGRQWGPDLYFTGGQTSVRSSERILRTLDPDIYRRLRTGEFTYDIPLPKDNYELHLHFAETGLADSISAESSGEGERVFRVLANGTRLLDRFDVISDAAGSNVADERVFHDIQPAADGLLHLRFEPLKSAAMVSAIEVLPSPGGRTQPIRIRAGRTAPWRDSTGQQWLADSFFLGGNAMLRGTNPARDSRAGGPGLGIYESERWGHFSYALPVAEGRYRVTLRFCEGHFGRRNVEAGGEGSRVFDVYANGVALLRNFDIYKEAGGEGRPVERSFSGIRPNAQGKVVLQFVPVVGMACVNAIEVTAEGK